MHVDINHYLIPPRLRLFRKDFDNRPFTLLDIGCTSGSSLVTKAWYPNCAYVGLNLSRDVLSAGEIAAMDEFIEADLERDDLSRLPDGSFDVIVVAHVIEHLSNGLAVLSRLATKLAAGGRLYVEFPSVRSLGLPSAVGTLNFCDDPTHIRLYDVKEVANELLASGLRIVRGGRRKDYRRMLLAPLTLPLQIKTLLREGRLHGTGMWDLLGFADFVYARRA
jgi:SAM-dependent methyltransferase